MWQGWKNICFALKNANNWKKKRAKMALKASCYPRPRWKNLMALAKSIHNKDLYRPCSKYKHKPIALYASGNPWNYRHPRQWTYYGSVANSVSAKIRIPLFYSNCYAARHSICSLTIFAIQLTAWKATSQSGRPSVSLFVSNARLLHSLLGRRTRLIIICIR